MIRRMIQYFKPSASRKLGLPKRLWNPNELNQYEQKKYQNSSDQISEKLFIEIVNDNFIPFLRSYGFKGRKNSFYKKDSQWIFTIHIFKDKWGGSCTINTGVHVCGIETVLI